MKKKKLASSSYAIPPQKTATQYALLSKPKDNIRQGSNRIHAPARVKTAEARSTYRRKMQSGPPKTNAAWVHLLEITRMAAEISVRMEWSSPETMAQDIRAALEQVGKTTGSERCIFIFISPASGRMQETFEWAIAGLASKMDSYCAPLLEAYQLCKDYFRQDDVLYISRASDIPTGKETDAIKELHESVGEKSWLLIPILVQGKLMALFGMSTCSKECTWNNTEISLMRMVVENIAALGERVRLQRDLVAGSERYQRIAHSATDYIYTVRVEDGKAVETRHGDGCVGITGYSVEELHNYPNLWIEMVPPEDREAVLAFADQVASGREAGSIEHRICRKDGEMRWVRSTAVPQRDREGNLVAYDGIINDINERKRAEDETRILNAELEQRVAQRTEQLEAANREMESFAYSISHDLRAPVRSLLGFSELLLEGHVQAIPEPAADYVRRIHAASQQMSGLIEDLLQLARFSREKLQPQRVDLGALATSIIAELRRAEPERAVEFILQGDLIVMADEHLMVDTLENLLENAWKFTSKQSQARIEFGREQSAEGGMEYYVRDNGVGFDMAYASRLFGAFQRLHSVEEFPGNGIGLASVNRIIHHHGGKVRAVGKVGEGAVFYFTLPENQE